MTTKTLLYLILLCLATIVASEVRYFIRPSSQSQSCDDQCSSENCVDNDLTLSHFINNSIDYLTNDTRLIFSPGNYSLESELIVKNVHLFSMFSDAIFSSKAVITCGHNARFEFRNVSIVTVSGLEFFGCFENFVVSVGQFQLYDSGFFGHGQAIFNGTVLSIEESVANLDMVTIAYIFAVTTSQELSTTIISSPNKVIGISLKRSSINITRSQFEGNSLGIGGVIYSQFSSDIAIYNTTFVNNNAALYCFDNFCLAGDIVYVTTGISFNRSTVGITESRFEGNNVGIGGVIASQFSSDIITIFNTTFVNNNAGAIVSLQYTKGSIVKIYHNKFVQNSGRVAIYSSGDDMLVSHSKFINNTGSVLLGAVNTSVCLSHSEFVFNNNDYVLFTSHAKSVSISHSEFVGNENELATVYVDIQYMYHDMLVSHSKFINNTGSVLLRAVNASVSLISHSEFVFNSNDYVLLISHGKSVSISHSEFVGNENEFETVHVFRTMITSVYHSKFINNTASRIVYAVNINMESIITHCEFVDNTATYPLVRLDGVIISVSLNEFINNSASDEVVVIRYYTTAENLYTTNNVFSDNSAGYEVFVSSTCRPGFILSLGSSRCIQCSENWRQHRIGILIAAFVAGIALVILMLALNMTVAIGTLNGILFYANIVAANADTYFLPFTTPAFVTVFIMWLNLDIGFDVCFFESGFDDLIRVYKALIQLAFPAYVIILVIAVIVASECSSKFAKIIGEGNPVAVLATMILLSYAKFLNAILASVSLLYNLPAYGSYNLDIKRLRNIFNDIEQRNHKQYQVAAYSLLVVSILIFLFCIINTALVFSWQWLLLYQDKTIFKWVRYQKLHHFLEPYHAPYTRKYRYWTGFLLFVRVLLYLISALNFSLDPRVYLMFVIIIVGGLILLKGVTAKRVYNNWPLDIMETAIYFNLVAFSAATWYNLDFGGNQVAVAYTSVMIIFILLLGIIVFHVLHYTSLHKYSFVEKAFKWTSYKLMEKEPNQKDGPEELDGERSAAGGQELPKFNVTHSVVEMCQLAQNQEEES